MTTVEVIAVIALFLLSIAGIVALCVDIPMSAEIVPKTNLSERLLREACGIIRYTEYMDIFAVPIERLHHAVRKARKMDQPEYYDYAVRQLIQQVLQTAKIKTEHIYTVDPEAWLP